MGAEDFDSIGLLLLRMAPQAQAHKPQKKHVYGLGSVPQQHPNGPDPAVIESNILGSPSSPYQNKNFKKNFCNPNLRNYSRLIAQISHL